MANWSIDGKTSEHDLALQRQAAGTVGDSHYVPSSLTGRSAANVIAPMDAPVKYYGGSWSVTALDDVNNFLGYRSRSNTADSYLEVQFNGSTIALVGNIGPDKGKYNVYIDGALALGATQTTTTLASDYFVSNGLDATSTDIAVASTSGFASSGTIVIEGEEITYSAIATSFTGFTGCVRGANGTTAAIHQARVVVAQADTAVDGYSQYYKKRVITWKKSNLPQGPHTLRVTVRSDKNASASDYYAEFGGFITGGVLGGQNILTNLQYHTATGVTNGSGILTGQTLVPAVTNQQLLAVIGAYPTAGATWAYPMYNPTDGTYSFVTSAVSGSVTLIVTALYLGQTF